MTILFTWPTPTNEIGLIDWLKTEDAISRAMGYVAGYIAAYACGHMRRCHWPYIWRKSSAAVHCMMPSFCICTPGKEVGLTMRLYATKKEMRYKYLHKIDRLKVEIVYILVIITAVTQNHVNCRISRHKAKITVITAIVNSWFTYIINMHLRSF